MKRESRKKRNAQTPQENTGEKPVLIRTENGLTLTDGRQTMTGDFSSLLSRISENNLRGELLVKASKIRGLDRPVRVTDATAGMGEDSFLLAAAGFQVKLYERDPVIAALLRDALERAALDPDLASVVSRMEFFEEDSLQAMRRCSQPPDVILLDPMFPERKKSGLIKKKFQLLQQLEQPCSDEEELMEAAISAHPRKIVVKRPLKGPWLAGRKPHYSLKGKAIRYDCFVL